MAIHPTAIVAPGARGRPELRDRPLRGHRPQGQAWARDNTVGPHAVVDRPHHARRGQPHLPARRGRRAAAGPQVPRRGHPARDRRREPGPRVRHGPHRDGGGRRGDPHRPTGASSWPRPTSPTTASSATAASSPTSARWPDTSRSEDDVLFGGLSAVHQFSRIGRLAFVGGLTGVIMDVAPYFMVSGHRGELVGINTRRHAARRHHRGAGRPGQGGLQDRLPLQAAARRRRWPRLQAELGQHPEIAHLVTFIEGSKRGITR